MHERFDFEPQASPLTHDYLGTRIGSNAKLHDELGRILPRLNEMPQDLVDDAIIEYHQITREIADILKRSPKLHGWNCLNPYGFEKGFEIGGQEFHATAKFDGLFWMWELRWAESAIREPAWSLAHATDEIAAWRVFLNRRYVTHEYESEAI